MTGPLSRAHRRFLGVTLPPHALPKRGDFQPLEQVDFTPVTRKALQEHVTTAGRLRGGILLGLQEGGRLHIHAVLPGGYGGFPPLSDHGQYVLGAVEAAQQVTGMSLDWVGSWMMPADGLAPDGVWSERAWHLARRHALVSPETVLVTFGQSQERLDVRAWSEDNGEPRPLQVDWERPAGEGA